MRIGWFCWSVEVAVILVVRWRPMRVCSIWLSVDVVVLNKILLVDGVGRALVAYVDLLMLVLS